MSGSIRHFTLRMMLGSTSDIYVPLGSFQRRARVRMLASYAAPKLCPPRNTRYVARQVVTRAKSKKPLRTRDIVTEPNTPAA